MAIEGALQLLSDKRPERQAKRDWLIADLAKTALARRINVKGEMLASVVQVVFEKLASPSIVNAVTNQAGDNVKSLTNSETPALPAPAIVKDGTIEQKSKSESFLSSSTPTPEPLAPRYATPEVE